MALTEARADVREGGRWSVAQRARNGLVYVALRFALGVTFALPRSALRPLGRAVATLAYLLFGPARRLAGANAERVLGLTGKARASFVRRCYWRLGGHLGDTLALLLGAPFEPLPMSDEHHAVLEGALREGNGVVLAAAHLGPWEHVAATLVSRGFPLTTLARRSYDPRLDPLYDRLRGHRSVGVIYRGDPGAATRIVRTLRSGGLLGAPMDFRSRVPSVVVPFLGHPAETALGPARLALRAGAAVVVCTVTRAPSLALTCTRIPTHRAHPGPPGATDTPESVAVEALTARINAELTARILATPLDWPWMHDRFASPLLSPGEAPRA